MSWRLIKEIQGDTDLRLILPFGLTVRLGDVISVGKDGTLKLEGSAKSMLRMSAGKPREGDERGVDLLQQSKRGTKFSFRAAGTASTLFENLPSADAGFDIEFGSADAWLMALKGRSIDTLDELERFRRPILDAYHWGAWRADWALVTAIATVQGITLLAAESSGTKVALSTSAQFAPNASVEVKLTAGASVLATSSEIVQCIRDEPLIAFISAIRVKPGWLKNDIGALEPRRRDVLPEPEKAAHHDFWESLDAGLGPRPDVD